MNTAPLLERLSFSALTTKIFADGADLTDIRDLARDPVVKGFTTNPTLMRRAGVVDYRKFARQVIREVGDRPICFEVIADDLREMERQARDIASWGPMVYVKIPPCTTAGESTGHVIRSLARAGVRLNVTALLTLRQVEAAIQLLGGGPPAFLSVFAGRIADTGRDPVPIMTEAVRLLRQAPQLELVWASPRELLNVFQADAIGCHIITVTSDILAKAALVGKDLEQYSLETIRMLVRDAQHARYAL